MNTPITDAAKRTYRASDPRDNWSYVDVSVASRLETDRAALMEALEGLVKANEDWNATVAQIVTTPPTWSDIYLDASRTALTAARANFSQP